MDLKFLNEIGVIIFSPLAGWIYNQANFETTFYILKSIVILFVLFSIFALNSDEKQLQTSEAILAKE